MDARTWFTPKQKAELWERWKSGHTAGITAMTGFDRGRVKTRLHDCVGSDTRAGGRT